MKYAYLSNPETLEYIYGLDITEVQTSITLIDLAGSTIGAIAGRITGGSITLNRDSLIRRTGSLSLVTDPADTEEGLLHQVTNINNLLSLNKQMVLEIGIKNTGIEYPSIDVFWFPMGTYVISNPAVTHDQTGVKINIKLEDKMTLLNGTHGGTIPIATTLSPYEDRSPEGRIEEVTTDKNGNTVTTVSYQKKKTPIIELVQDIVTEFSDVDLASIIVDDIPRRIRNTVHWMGNQDTDSEQKYHNIYVYYTQDEDKKNPREWHVSLTKPTANVPFYHFTEGDSIGYYYTDFVYPDKELSTSYVDTVASVLTKIRDKLGNFEFFFDTEGFFHFREARNFLNSGSSENELVAAVDDKYVSRTTGAIDKTVFDFTSGAYITAYSNNPNYAKIKNDITIWIEKGESKRPCRYHLIIDAPEPMHKYAYDVYTDAYGVLRAENVRMDQEGCTYTPADSRMNLYLYYLAKQREESTGDVGRRAKTSIGKSKLAKELIEFWPLTYNVDPNSPGFISEDFSSFDYYFEILDVSKLRYNREVAQLAISEIGAREKVLQDKQSNCLFAKNTALDLNFIKQVEPALFTETWTYPLNTSLDTVTASSDDKKVTIDATLKPVTLNVTYRELRADELVRQDFTFTLPVTKEDPANQDQTIQTMESYSPAFKSELWGKDVMLKIYTDVDKDGTLVLRFADENNKQISLHHLDNQNDRIEMYVTAEGEYWDPDGESRKQREIQECKDNNKEYVIVPHDIYQHLGLGAKAQPAAEYMRNVLHEYIGYNNSISLTTIPLYHLDVNSRISVEDEASDIHGDYIITSLTIPLDLSGKMTINATKALERI